MEGRLLLVSAPCIQVMEKKPNTNDLVSLLCHDAAAAVKTASEIASKAPVAVRGTKIYLLHGRDHT